MSSIRPKVGEGTFLYSPVDSVPEGFSGHVFKQAPFLFSAILGRIHELSPTMNLVDVSVLFTECCLLQITSRLPMNIWEACPMPTAGVGVHKLYHMPYCRLTEQLLI